MKNVQYEYYDVKKIKDIKELYEYAAAEYGESTAFRYEQNKKDVCISFNKFKSDIEGLGTYILSRGIKNSKIVLYAENSYEWILSYFAAVCSGQIIVPIDKALSISEVANLIEDCGAKIVIYGKSKEKNLEELKELAGSTVEHYICSDEIDALCQNGRKIIAEGGREYFETDLNPEELAAIIYTSGTTGKPKGVMLSGKNLAYDTYASSANLYIPSDTTLLLPLNHTFGFMAGVLCMILRGYSVYINQSMKNILSDIKKSKPGHISLVPLFIEKFYKTIWKTAEKSGKAGALKKLVALSNKLRKVGIDLRPVLFKSVRDAFGGRLEMLISGGAPIDKKYIDGFDDFGIKIVQGYGITECSPIVSTERNKFAMYGSVGVPVPGCEAKILDPNEDGEGEILIKGDIVMMGYYNNPEATDAAFEGEWFKTGDIGKIDKDGFIFITGRKKNIIILSNAKNVYPEEIEAEILKVEGVDEVLVYGEENVITAEIYTETPDKKEDIRQNVQKLNSELPSYKQVKHIKFRDVEFEKTTTKKIKRFLH